MLFYRFFKANMGTRMLVMLKTDVYISGVLVGVDPYLNVKLRDTRILSEHPGLCSVSVCSIRGSAIKYVLIDEDEKMIEGVNSGSRLRMLLDSCY